MTSPHEHHLSPTSTTSRTSTMKMSRSRPASAGWRNG